MYTLGIELPVLDGDLPPGVIPEHLLLRWLRPLGPTERTNAPGGGFVAGRFEYIVIFHLQDISHKVGVWVGMGPLLYHSSSH